MSRKLTVKGAHKKAWKACSEYIRKRDKGKCITCGSEKDYTEMHAGHYVHSGNSRPVTHYMEENIHCQCPQCNNYKSGNLTIYSLMMHEKYGSEFLTELERLKRQPKKWTVEELLEIETFYKEKLKQLEE